MITHFVRVWKQDRTTVVPQTKFPDLESTALAENIHMIVGQEIVGIFQMNVESGTAIYINAFLNNTVRFKKCCITPSARKNHNFSTHFTQFPQYKSKNFVQIKENVFRIELLHFYLKYFSI